MSQTTTQFATEYPSIADLTEDERHSLFRPERRNLALAVLTDRTTPIERADLAAAVAAREDDRGPADEEAVRRVEIALHHTHLPKMDDLGVIDYDRESGRVTR